MNVCLLCGNPARTLEDRVWIGPPAESLNGLALCPACAASSVAGVMPELARLQPVVLAAIRAAHEWQVSGDDRMADVMHSLINAVADLPPHLIASAAED